MTTVSIIIPCYRDKDTLARAVASVKAQTYAPIEIVVVNDCSPDTLEIETCLSSFPDVRYVRNAENLGLAATRNTGVAAATGDIVAFLDADDEYHPDKIRIQLEQLEPGCAVTCGIQHVVRGVPVPVRRVPVKPLLVSWSRSNIFRNRLNGAGLMISRDLFHKVGGYDERLRSCEDFDFWLRLLEVGVRIKDVRQPLYLYHYNDQGLSKNIRNISYWEFEVVRRYLERQPEHQRQSAFSSIVVVSWMLRHLWRGFRTADPIICERTMGEMELLGHAPVTRRLMQCVGAVLSVRKRRHA